MQSYIGGLFKQEQKADLARQTLRQDGFTRDSVHLLARKLHTGPIHRDRVQAPAVGRSAVWGAIVLGIAGALFGLATGLGIIPIPGLGAARSAMEEGFILGSIASGAILGGLTGAILGVALRLTGSRDKVSITDQGVKRGGILLVARVDEKHTEETARRVMEDNGAVDVQNLTDKWDLSVWSDFQEVPPETVAKD